MEPPIDRIRLSSVAKEQLTALKQVTQIEQWNVLCRWAFCLSLAEPTEPSPASFPADSNVEMSWRVFAGEMSDLLLIALKQRCRQDNLGSDRQTLAEQFRFHLHRGIGYLGGEDLVNEIEDLIKMSLSSTH